MRRTRGGHELSLWQFAVLAVLYTGGRIKARHSKRLAMWFFWVEWSGAPVRLNSRTLRSLQERGLVSWRSLRISALGRVVVESMSDEEIGVAGAVLPVHDLRCSKPGTFAHGMERIEAVAKAER